MKKNLFFTLGLVSLLIVSSCKKYDEGGLISETEDNIQSTWVLDKYFRNATDETSKLLIKNYEETYADGEKYSRSYTDKDNKAENQTGTWKFDKEKQRINISGVSSVEFTTEGSVSSSYFEIIKLTGDEFWYSFTNGSDKHEFHFVEK